MPVVWVSALLRDLTGGCETVPVAGAGTAGTGTTGAAAGAAAGRLGAVAAWATAVEGARDA